MATQLSTKQHARAILLLGLPLIGSHLAQFAITMTDTLMLGWYAIDALAAVVLGGSFFFVFFIFGSGFALAVMPVVATAAASGQQAQVRRVTRMALWLSLLFGVVFMPVFVFAQPLLLAIGQTPEIAQLAADYLQIAGWGLIPALLAMVLRSYLAALERTQVVFWIIFASVLLNILVNYLLIF
ncbi:MAG: MATE family efflux transporter, partial [Paracoccaceae bacterium]